MVQADWLWLCPPINWPLLHSATLSGNIKLDATNIYGGVYSADLKIETNVPNQEHLGKPVELTVEGEAAWLPKLKLISARRWLPMISLNPLANYKESQIANDDQPVRNFMDANGRWYTRAFAAGVGIGWWLVRPEWRWADISELYSPWAWQTRCSN